MICWWYQENGFQGANCSDKTGSPGSELPPACTTSLVHPSTRGRPALGGAVGGGERGRGEWATPMRVPGCAPRTTWRPRLPPEDWEPTPEPLGLRPHPSRGLPFPGTQASSAARIAPPPRTGPPAGHPRKQCRRWERPGQFQGTGLRSEYPRILKGKRWDALGWGESQPLRSPLGPQRDARNLRGDRGLTVSRARRVGWRPRGRGAGRCRRAGF